VVDHSIPGSVRQPATGDRYPSCLENKQTDLACAANGAARFVSISDGHFADANHAD
jgi:hypothetical protein